MNFEAALKSLTAAQVNFIVVGAYAGVVQGVVQVTRDLDICYERTPENMQRLVTALAPFHPALRGAPPEVPFIFDARSLAQGMNFTFQADFGDIDLLGELSGIGRFSDLARDTVSIELFGMPIRVASLDALIRSKRAAGRPKDLLVLPELEAVKRMRSVEDPSKKDKQ
jgi:hypothetical protein